MKSNVQYLKQYGRGIIGGLLFSLSIIYTMEVWWTGFIASPQKLLAFVIITFLLLLGYNRFAGIREDVSFLGICRESVEEIGVAFVVTFLFLWLINRVGFGMSFQEIAGKVIVESMIVAIGISVGTAQLGQEDDSDQGKNDENENDRSDNIWKFLILSICGGVLIAAPVAPTQEILVLAAESSNIKLLLMVVISLLLSAIVLFSDFKGSVKSKTTISQIILGVITVYLAAVLVATGFLWIYDRLSGFGFHIILAEIIVLAIPATIGASVGRLLLK